MFVTTNKLNIYTFLIRMAVLTGLILLSNIMKGKSE